MDNDKMSRTITMLIENSGDIVIERGFAERRIGLFCWRGWK